MICEVLEQLGPVRAAEGPEFTEEAPSEQYVSFALRRMSKIFLTKAKAGKIVLAEDTRPNSRPPA
jgi:hypothetical protein